MDRVDKILFAFASYNAGPARSRELRNEAAAGLDPNRWFNNVELDRGQADRPRDGAVREQHLQVLHRLPAPRGRTARTGACEAAEARRLGLRPGYNPRVMAHDLVVRDGTVVTATETLRCDVGIDGGRITAVGGALPPGRRELDARGLYVLPGGIDSHVHLEQVSSAGVMCADDFHSGTVSAAFGGTTTVVPFAAQHRGMKLRAVVEDYHRRASEKGGDRLRLSSDRHRPDREGAPEDLPRLVAEGITSLKVYMTYDRLPRRGTSSSSTSWPRPADSAPSPWSTPRTTA